MAKGPLKSPQQERFAQLFVETGEATEAYRQAFTDHEGPPKSPMSRACALKKVPAVQERIRELQKAAVKRHEISLDIITEGILRNIALAELECKPSIAIRGYVELARIHGFIKEPEPQKPPEPDIVVMSDEYRAIADRYFERRAKEAKLIGSNHGDSASKTKKTSRRVSTAVASV